MNNIICEEIVGMFSSLQNRASNATIANISAKIKCTKNGTVDYLLKMTEEERAILIKKSICVSAKLKQKSKENVKAMHKVIVSRVHEKVNEKQRKKRKGLEKRIKEAVKKKQDMKEILDCTEVQAKMVNDIIDGGMIGKEFIHVWTNKKTKVDEDWNGRIMRMNDEPVDNCIVNYWKEDSSEDLGDEFPMNSFQLAADYVCGDLQFI